MKTRRSFFAALAVIALSPQLLVKAKASKWKVVKNIQVRSAYLRKHTSLYQGWVSGEWFDARKYATFEEWLAAGDVRASERRSGLGARFIKGKWAET